MNKKIIAIAIAAAMAAPVAMADVKMSGRVNAQYGIVSVDGATTDPMGRLDDSGQGRFQIDAKSGDAYARWAIDTRYGRDNNAATNYSRTNRDSYVGYKFGGVKVQYGRMGNAAKNLEKDPYIATFLQIRGNSEAVTGGKFGSSSFVDDVFQLATKVGGAKLKIQANFDDTSGSTSSTNEGHIGVSIAGKAGPVRYWAGYNTGSADGAAGATPANDDSNIKVGGEMKFGSVKVGLNYTTADNNGAGTDNILVTADMGLGKGLSLNAGYGMADGDVVANESTWMRLAINKKLDKGVNVYAGYVATDLEVGNDSSTIGAGMTFKF